MPRKWEHGPEDTPAVTRGPRLVRQQIDQPNTRKESEAGKVGIAKDSLALCLLSDNRSRTLKSFIRARRPISFHSTTTFSSSR